MRKASFALVTFIGMFFIWMSYSQAFEVITRDVMQKETVTQTDLIRLVDNFIVLFDTSGSANENVPGREMTKIQASKAQLVDRNAWLPELGYKAGLYIYTDNKTLMGTFKEVVGMQPYSRETFAAGINQLPDKGQGPTMLQPAMSGLRDILKGLSGKTAVIMFTDGSFTVNRGTKRPLEIAQELAEDHDVCFYLISSATTDMNKNLLAAVSKVNACSRVIPLTAFLDDPLYLSGALFTVKTTSYERLKPVTQTVGFVTDDILFDFNSADLRPEYSEKKDKLVDFLKQNPDTHVVAAGFADSAGDEEYNLGLSERRAASVKRALTDAGISGDRIVTLWFGELNPVADNATEDGRQLNRRVELAVAKIK